MLAGVALLRRDPRLALQLLPVAAFQLATAPVLAQVVGRAAYRVDPVCREQLVVDELTEALDQSELEQSEA